jgi:hypothetical protein
VCVCVPPLDPPCAARRACPDSRARHFAVKLVSEYVEAHGGAFSALVEGQVGWQHGRASDDAAARRSL